MVLEYAKLIRLVTFTFLFKIMRLVYATLELLNAGDLAQARRNRLPESEVKRMKVPAMVDVIKQAA